MMRAADPARLWHDAALTVGGPVTSLCFRRAPRAALVAALALSACQGELDVSWDAPGCTNVDFDEELVSALEVEIIDADIVARRTGVEQPCDAVFDPSVSVKGTEIVIEEVWIEGEPGACGDVCFDPTVTIADPKRGSWTVLWFVEGESAAFDNAQITVD